MPKNFKKLLVCIVATFGITAMVFSCCKKVGLCASSGSSVVSTFPLPYNYELNSIERDFQADANRIRSVYPALSGSHAACFFLENGSGTTQIFYMFYYPSLTQLDVGTTFSSLSDIGDFNFSSSFNVQGYIIEYTTSGSSNWEVWGNVNTQPALRNWVEESSSGSYILKQGTKVGFPIWSEIPIVFSDGSLAFGSGSTISGHTKGGVLSNYIDSDDLIESSSDLPKVDTSAPSNSSSIPDWLQKILNGISKVNQSIQGGVLTIGDYIGSITKKIGEWFQNTIDSIDGFFGRVEDKLDDIIDSIEDLFDGTTVSQAQSVWEQEFNNSVFKDFVDLKSTIETDILTPIKNANAPSTLSFTIPLISVNVPRLINSGGNVSTATNNVYLFGQSVTLDFSWYTRSISGGVFNGSSIRDYLVPIIATFLYVGMVVHLLFKIPSFLNGSSGFSNILHSVVVSNNGSKFKKA